MPSRFTRSTCSSCSGSCASADARPTHSGNKDRRTTMNIDRAVLAFAGMMVLASVALVYFVSPWWLLLTAFVGLNLLQSSVTGFCPAAMVFRKLGLPGGCAFK
ncbi:YgaP family membrane protein [Pseudoxanthomonas kaohsiungensis]